ncbi:MAG: hypothetical protein HY577_00065 [Candidatus Nealsonbacteria bacterium]|nr:hypothetical protein [Candidatus Nealsonbacteria bacterium]
MELINFIFESSTVQFLIFLAKVVGPIVFLFFLGVNILSLKKSTFIQMGFWQDMIELKNQKAYGAGKVEKKWLGITKRLEAPNAADWKLAVIEAETLTEEILTRMGFGGETFGDRLKKISPSQLPSLNDLIQAHQVRQNIVHDPDYRLDFEEASRTLGVYERSLRELDAL